MKYLGTRKAVTSDELADWLDKINRFSSRAKEHRGAASDAVRRFFGVNKYGSDGIKRSHPDGGAIKPFKGAANNVVNWGDTALDTELSIAMETFRLAQRVVVPTAGGSAADDICHKLSLLLTWALNHIEDFEDQIKLALRHMLVNSPGVSLVQILWNKRAIYGPRRLTRVEVMQALLATLPPREDEETLEPRTLISIIEDEMIPELVLNTIQSLTGADIRMCEEILEALLVDDVVEYPGIVGFDEGPAIKALEYGTDFLLPDYCTSFDLCELWCRQEWVSEAQLRDLAASNDWDDEFVEETLQYGGKAVLSELYRSDYADDEFKDLYQLVYVYTAETTETGSIARYQTVLSAAQDITACGKELLRGRRGRYPAVYVQRERQTENITRARGLAELVSPAIDLAKQLADAGSNNANVGSLPPILARGTDNKITLSPLKVINLRPSAEVKFLQPPAYPAQGTAEYRRLKDEVLERLGVATKESDPNSIAIRRRERMAMIVKFLRQVLTGVLSITQAHASPMLFAQILGEADAADPRLRFDIDGAYQVALKVNVDELDRDTLVTKMQTLANVVPVLDRRLEADTAPILRHAVRLLFPTAADEVLSNVNTGTAAEVRDERNNFVQIKAGVQPEMNTEGGWNYQTRLGVWQQLLQNPNVMADWTPEAQAFAQQWMQALQHLAQQFGENASLGKTGAEGVMPMR